MGKMWKCAIVMGVAGVLAGCTDPTGFGVTTLAKGTQLDARALISQNRGKRGCVGYDAASQSCSALTRSRVVGNTVIGEEITAVRSPATGKPVRVVVATRGQLRGKDICVKASGIKAGAGNEDPALAQFAVGFAQELIKEAGEVCSSYFEAGDRYVLSSRTANGEIFPPGDTAFRIVDGKLSLRLQ